MINSGKEWDWIQELYHKEQLQQKDFYWENGLKVMTEKYHLKRGHCCNSGCKHCPYNKENNGK